MDDRGAALAMTRIEITLSPTNRALFANLTAQQDALTEKKNELATLLIAQEADPAMLHATGWTITLTADAIFCTAPDSANPDVASPA
jgi:hypothetical protein